MKLLSNGYLDLCVQILKPPIRINVKPVKLSTHTVYESFHEFFIHLFTSYFTQEFSLNQISLSFRVMYTSIFASQYIIIHQLFRYQFSKRTCNCKPLEKQS